MKNRVILIAATAALYLMLPGCFGGLTPQEHCNEVITVTCGKVFECFTEQERIAGGYGGTESGCISQLKTQAGCEEKTDENACEGALEFDGSSASECVDQLEAASCSQWKENADAEVVAPSCKDVCTAP